MTAPKDRRTRPRESDSTLTQREHILVDVAVERTLGKLGVQDLEEYTRDQEMQRAAMQWFSAMRDRERRRADFFRKLGGDLAMDAAKYTVRGILLLVVFAGGYAVTLWARVFYESGGKAP